MRNGLVVDILGLASGEVAHEYLFQPATHDIRATVSLNLGFLLYVFLFRGGP
jgi:hypothetical protein